MKLNLATSAVYLVSACCWFATASPILGMMFLGLSVLYLSLAVQK